MEQRAFPATGRRWRMHILDALVFSAARWLSGALGEEGDLHVRWVSPPPPSPGLFVVCPTGLHPPLLRLARRLNRGHSTGAGGGAPLMLWC